MSMLVGTCLGFCPLHEAKERRKMQELSKYERPPYLPVKKFRRSAAGTVIKPHDVRPVHVLVETTAYLLSLLPSQLTLPLDLYHFLDDRFRAVRSDLTLQGAFALDVLQPIARFYILAQCILRLETRSGSVPYASLEKLLEDQLASVLLLLRESSVEFRRLLEDQLASVLLLLRESSVEFRRLYLVLHQDARDFCRPGDATWRSTLALCTPAPYLSARPSSLETNLLARALRFRKIGADVHQQMVVLAKAYTKQDRFPVADLARFLRLDDAECALAILRGYGVAVTPSAEGEPAYFRFNEAPLPDAMTSDAMTALLASEFAALKTLGGDATFSALALLGQPL
ncbi:hypothetical protein SPRG_05948 [Saprolegnia parasitica CBS 223.65]|uniref:SAC3/GANP/THP3 conserved domain-containing protein n=1 Tax=Saprolegnia parasitica (strain CBS 223.65) TaxID=695850 RepID=A0A067CSA6_SAPPC|nr:hypothetical protein SPRG_05948 [Saprolegnia parasitica CBS 223.65]KDO29411.1 hypothetical protein SPRG_05948 [Saprolegnia parasitica CBS 223.65]|eukprot:XP_012199913.1 hypothetical protein SPRG_05948 [Saprolegnia parasitica CBS 223.65]